ncbi:hypothetical protein [Deinococcus xinjiangensis]
MKKILLVGAALASLTAVASSFRPLVMVGKELNWPTGEAQVQLHVRERGLVTLRVNRSGFQTGNYRQNNSGDEQYAPGQVVTTYTLKNNVGRVLFERQFNPNTLGPALLYMSVLPAGEYTLTASLTGKAKRSVALIADGPVDLSQLSVTDTVQGRTWKAVSAFDSTLPVNVKLFNGDQPAELEVRLRYADGRVLPLPAAVRGTWQSVTVPAGVATLEARQGPQPTQWSKSFTVQFIDSATGNAAPQTTKWKAATAQAPATSVNRTQIVEIKSVQPQTILVVGDDAPSEQAASSSPLVDARPDQSELGY